MRFKLAFRVDVFESAFRVTAYFDRASDFKKAVGSKLYDDNAATMVSPKEPYFPLPSFSSALNRSSVPFPLISKASYMQTTLSSYLPPTP